MRTYMKFEVDMRELSTKERTEKKVSDTVGLQA